MNHTILVVEDDAALREALCDTLEMDGYRTVEAAEGAAALEQLQRAPVDLVLSDVHMDGMDGHTLLRSIKQRWPEIPVVLLTAYAAVQKAVQAMREGAADYVSKPLEAERLLEVVGRYAVAGAGGTQPVCEAAASRDLFALAERVAAVDATIMLLGESGTGKEVVARYIHNHSPRAERPFVAINCAAIPENMLEATLFGYEKGAFTGAHKTTPGKFEQAQGGTLLLDEVSEMELGLQAKLLRVLQEREVERLGGGRVIDLDVRVLATTNRDLRAQVAEGGFREDLYYRLNVFPLRLPPLRERRADIAPLAERFLAEGAGRSGRPMPTLDAAARRALEAHPWPGNVRELQNVMQRALILQPGGVIGAGDLHFEEVTAPSAPVTAPAPAAGDGGERLGDELRSREYRLILDALKLGSRKRAAEHLGISPRTLRYKLARMREEGVEVPERLSA